MLRRPSCGCGWRTERPLAVAELELIRHIRQLARGERPEWLELGVGDDSAVLRLPSGQRLAVTTDMLVEGTHFERGAEPEAVGRKAVGRALSDLAAMACRPLCVLAAASFGPGTDEEYWHRLCEALWRWSGRFGAPLVGGDVSSGPAGLTLAVTALGLEGPRGFVTRSGARPGECVCVTGAFGGSMLGRHLEFVPRIREALELAERFEVSAMIDVSDGLSTDLLHIAEASAVGMEIEAAAIPIHRNAEELARREGAGRQKALAHALGDGEDYEIIFCAPKPEAEVAAGEGVQGVDVTVIGRVTESGECILVLPEGTRQKLRGEGWEHLT